MNYKNYMKKFNLFFNVEKKLEEIAFNYRDQFKFLSKSGTSKVKAFFPEKSLSTFEDMQTTDAACIFTQKTIVLRQYFNKVLNNDVYIDYEIPCTDFFNLCSENNMCSLQSLEIEIDVKNKKLSYSADFHSSNIKKSAVVLFDMFFNELQNKRFLELSSNEYLKNSISYENKNYTNAIIYINLNNKLNNKFQFDTSFLLENHKEFKTLNINYQPENYIFDDLNFNKMCITIQNGILQDVIISKNNKEEHFKNYKNLLNFILKHLNEEHFNELNKNKESWFY